MKYRLQRLDEIHFESPLYFLTFCTSGHSEILAQPVVHESFQLFAGQGITRRILVGRYVIMPDHIRAFVALQEEERLSGWVKSLKNSLSKTLRGLGISAPHWQKWFFDHVMRSEESYGSKWNYVRENPVRKKLVSEASLWPFQGEINQLSYR